MHARTLSALLLASSLGAGWTSTAEARPACAKVEHRSAHRACVAARAKERIRRESRQRAVLAQDPATLFAPSSPWNAQLAADAPLDPSSAPKMSALRAEVASEVKAGIGPWISETQFSTPVYRVAVDQPKVRVVLDTGAWKAPLQTALDEGVPIPPNAAPAKGSDGHMTIYQPATDTLWEFWKAVRKTDGWHASWGGAMRNVSSSPGYYTKDSWSGLTAQQGWNWGSTATSLPVVAGTIMIDELRRGRIDHALAAVLPNSCTTTFAWPAQRTDGTQAGGSCIPEGAHLRIDPSLDLTKLTLPPITRMLAVAAQRYGIIVRDKSLRAVGFFAEDPTPTGSDPYHGPGGFYGNVGPWKFLPPFPWANLQLLKMRTCTSAPCLPAPAA